MSERPISVGDLVYVARPCPYCGYADDLGTVFKVFELYKSSEAITCCGKGAGEWAVCATNPKNHNDGFDLAWLKRIPPPDELEGEQHKEELTA